MWHKDIKQYFKYIIDYLARDNVFGLRSRWPLSIWMIPGLVYKYESVFWACVCVTDVVCRWKQNTEAVRSEVEAHIKTTVISQILFDQKFAWLLFQSGGLHRHYGWGKMEASYAASLCLKKRHIPLKITAWERRAWNDSSSACYRASYETWMSRKIRVVAFAVCIKLHLSVCFSVNPGFLNGFT